MNLIKLRLGHRSKTCSSYVHLLGLDAISGHGRLSSLLDKLGNCDIRLDRISLNRLLRHYVNSSCLLNNV
jgi:hypothetical protein